MALADVLSFVADGLSVIALSYTYFHEHKNRRPRMPKRLREILHRDDDDEAALWRKRLGRFLGLDPDAPGRVQVMPRPEPEDGGTETHSTGPGGYHDGPNT